MTDPAPYITATELRAAVSGLSGTERFPDATLERFVTRFEGLAERYRGVAYRPRSATTTLLRGAYYGSRWRLGHKRVSAVTAVTVATVDQSLVIAPVIEPGPTFDSIVPVSTWALDTPTVITYTHGYTEPPPAVIDACIEFVRAEALQQAGSQPRNTTGERTDLGWIPEPTVDWEKGRPTKWTVVNSALNEVPDERGPGLL